MLAVAKRTIPTRTSDSLPPVAPAVIAGSGVMVELLRRISLRDYRMAPGRLALIVGGVASGIALIAALSIINASVLSNFRTSLERAAGKAALQVVLGTGEVGFDEGAVAVVANDPGVAEAFGVVRGYLAATDGSGDVLQLFGVDLTSDAVDSYDVNLYEREGDDLELLNDPTSVLLTREYALRHAIPVGARVSFASPSGVRTLRVRGLLEPHGLAMVFGGNLAVMDLPAAQLLLAREGRVDQVDILLRTDRIAVEVQRRLAGLLPASLSVARPVTRGERFERAISAFQAMLDGLSILCLLAGVFIVYNTMATAITHRARDLSVLIALGTERRTVFLLVMIEAAVLGMVASVAGTALGYGLARVLLTLVANSMGVIYQTRFAVASFTLTAGSVAVYLLIGVAGSLVAAVAPALKASRLDPLELMRPDYRERLAIMAPNRLLLGIWVILVAFTLLAITIEERTRSIAWGNVGASLWWVSAVILAIPLMSGFSRLMRGLLPRLFGIDGRIAAESLTRSPGRTGVTTAVIALSLTLAVTLSSVAGSFRESERNWFILVGDLVVSAVATEGGWLESPLSATLGEELRTIPGVARVETYRALQGQPFHDGRIAIVAVSGGFIDTPLFRAQLVAGDADVVRKGIEDGRVVVVSDNLADRFGIAVGQTIEIPTPQGPRSFPVAGVLAADYSGDKGSILMSRDRFEALWGEARVSHFNVFLTPGATLEEVREGIKRALGQRYLLKVLTVPQTLAYHQGMVDRAFVFTYAIQLLVVVVTLAGILDLLTTQIIERQRELGTLRALGAEVPQIRRAITLEATLIGLAGAILGGALSYGTSLLWVHVNFRILIGYVLEHHFALLTAVWCVMLATGFAMLAGWLAARNALQYSVLDALRAE